MSTWYLIHSKPKQEYRAFDHLQNQGFEVYLPQLQAFRLKKGNQVKQIEPLFPRYLFIKLNETSSACHKIHSTRGVSGLVRFSEYPAEVPQEIIRQLRNQANPEGLIDQTGANQSIFRAGDAVSITDSSFVGLEAIVKEQDGDQRVNLFITMLGCKQVINLPMSAVSRL